MAFSHEHFYFYNSLTSGTFLSLKSNNNWDSIYSVIVNINIQIWDENHALIAYIQKIQGQAGLSVCRNVQITILRVSVPNMPDRELGLKFAEIFKVRLDWQISSRPSYLFSWLLSLQVCRQLYSTTPSSCCKKSLTDVWMKYISHEETVGLSFYTANYLGCYSWLSEKLKSCFPPLLKLVSAKMVSLTFGFDSTVTIDSINIQLYRKSQQHWVWN